MKDDQLHHLSMIEKLNITDALKIRFEDSFFEHMIEKLAEIKKDEEWDNEETGHKMADAVHGGG
jgi:hypothetical protein